MLCSASLLFIHLIIHTVRRQHIDFSPFEVYDGSTSLTWICILITEELQMKKILSTCLSFIILLSASTSSGSFAYAKTIHSQEDAVAWAKSKVGYQVGSGECVALTKAYYEYLGVASVKGNGCDYAWNTCPSGWQRIPYYSGFVAQVSMAMLRS